MAFTYNINDLTSSLSKVRLNIGDTIDLTAVNESLHDEEINVVLAEYGDVLNASVRACELLIARLRHKTSRSAVGINENAREKLDALTEILDMLKSRANTDQELEPFGGGYSQAASDAVEADTDFQPMPFAVGMHDKETDN